MNSAFSNKLEKLLAELKAEDQEKNELIRQLTERIESLTEVNQALNSEYLHAVEQIEQLSALVQQYDSLKR